MFDSLKPVMLTPLAAAEAKKIMRTKNIPPGYGLRLGVRGGHGCGGINFIIGFDKQKPADLSYEVEGIPVLVDKKHTMYLIGKAVDFYEGADARGFLFIEQEVMERGGWHHSTELKK
ncbi:MAG: iron-sulfur cluster assembly accessory protein [Bacteroidetes bacterium]|nr:iron-sulfur cluster assembly accessory protein [Bacteroidota bacterium]